jgi:hypothetical protein
MAWRLRYRATLRLAVPNTSEYNPTFQELETNLFSKALGSAEKNRKRAEC